MKSNINIPNYLEISSLFDENSIISKNLEGYEKRQGQIDMANCVYYAINNNQHALIEAPCGIGKSYAYIIPSILYSLKANQRIIISTYTKTLQEQLKKFDLPTILKKFDLEFKYKVVKGRNNYICLRKLEDIKINGIVLDLFLDGINDNKIKIQTQLYFDAINYIEKNNIGDFENLDHEAALDFKFLNMIMCSSIDCIGGRCKYFKECNYFSEIISAQKANIIVVNHSLYMTCLMLDSLNLYLNDTTQNEDIGENELLLKKQFFNPIPIHSYVIFDEAHHLSDVTQDAFSIRFSYDKIYLTILTISSSLKRAFNKKNKKIINKINDQILKIEQNLKLYFEYLNPLVNELINKSVEEILENNENKFKTTQNLLLEPYHIKLIVSNPNSQILCEEISNFLDLVEEISEILDEKNVFFNTLAIKNTLNEIKNLIVFWQNVKVSTNDKNLILWASLSSQNVNKNNSSLQLELISSPLVVDEILKNNLFYSKNSVILTSATLAIDNNFNYIKKEFGLEEFDTIEVILDSPYNFKEQAALYMPLLKTTPKDKEFSKEVAKYVQDIIYKSNGRTLVLFTSKAMMEYVYYEIATKLEIDGLKIYMQGQRNKSELLEIFRNNVHSSLFALDSFWEGVDIKGESLSTLIVTKLPFKVPTHPINKAREIYFQSQNRSAFYEYSLPWAIIKLKQGIGRLIRHKSDRGIVVILDKRVSTTTYGAKIQNELPKYHILKSIDEIATFLDKNNSNN